MPVSFSHSFPFVWNHLLDVYLFVSLIKISLYKLQKYKTFVGAFDLHFFMHYKSTPRSEQAGEVIFHEYKIFNEPDNQR